MDEKKLISQYNNAKTKFDAIAEDVSKHFMDQAKAAIAKGDINGALNIMYRCPDTVTKCFILDAINCGAK